MPTRRLFRCVLICEEGNGCKVVRVGQPMTWGECLKTLTTGMADVDAAKLLGWVYEFFPGEDWR